MLDNAGQGRGKTPPRAGQESLITSQKSEKTPGDMRGDLGFAEIGVIRT
jgi:hypothetical protein